MAEDLHFIRRFVASLVRRERLLLFGRVLLQAALLLVAVLALAVLAATLRWDRGTAVMSVVVLMGLGSWIFVALPLLLSWRSSGDSMRQARMVEALAPDLRGRLLTSVERVDGPARGESPALVGLVAKRAAAAARKVAVGRVHPAGHVLRLGALVAFLYLIALPTTLLAPGGPVGVFKWWAAGLSAEAAVAALGFERDPEYARVGDLVLKYTYPSYTGLEPKIVPNSTGDVRGPPGTYVEVVARSAEPVEAAGLVAYGEAFDVDVTEEGRSLRASFRIQVPDPEAEEDPTYHLVLYRDSEPVPSRDFAIETEEDLAPEVMLDGPEDVIEVAVDQPIGMNWRARDDYGISAVKLRVNGVSQDKKLYSAETRRAEAFDDLYVIPRNLGLEPGDEAELVIAAWDNNTISGSKAGYSRTIRVKVLGARGLADRIEARQGELLDLMVPVLAAFLVEPWPAGSNSGELAKWGEEVARRYAPLSDAAERLWQGMMDDTQDAALVQSVLTSGRDLIRYTQVAYTPASLEIPKDEDFEVTAELRDDAITSLENAILALDRMQRMRALRDVSKAAEDLAQAAKNFDEMLNNPDVEAQELLARLDQLERVMQKLMEAASKLDPGGLKEFLNGRENEVSSLMDEIRKAIAEGDMEQAQELMKRLQQMIDEMSQGIQDDMNQRQQGQNDSMEAAADLKKELKRLEDQQRQLQSDVQQLREEDDAEASEKAKDLWEKIEKKTRDVSDLGAKYTEELEAAKRPFYEVERTRSAVDGQSALFEAVSARDLRGSKDAVFDADQQWLHAWRTAQSERARRGSVAGPQPVDIEKIRRVLGEIEALLDELDRQSQTLDPSVREKAQELEDRQRELENQLEQARQQAKELSKQFPVQPEGMKESLQEANERMDEAGNDLKDGRPMQAEGSQGVAAERLKEAREALDNAMKQARQQQQQMQQGGKPGEQQSSEDQDGKDRGKDLDKPVPMEIPGREEFRTPEEYRRALLEGMEGEVPEEYRALKKRYYEELVHQ